MSDEVAGPGRRRGVKMCRSACLVWQASSSAQRINLACLNMLMNLVGER